MIQEEDTHLLIRICKLPHLLLLKRYLHSSIWVHLLFI